MIRFVVVDGADYEVLFDMHPHAMWVVDRETMRFLAVNRATCARYGWTREEFLTMTLRDIRPPETMDSFVAAFQLDEVGTYSRAARHRTKTGELMEVALTVIRLRWAGREASLAVVTDVTGVAEVQRRFDLLVDNSAEGISIVDERGMVRFISPSGARLLGRSPGEMIGTMAVSWVHPEDVTKIPRSTPGKAVRYLNRALHADGTYRYIESTATNLTHDPAVRAYVANFRDVTAQVEAEEQLRRSEAGFRTLIDRSPTAMFVHRDGRYVYINEAAATLLGYSRHELVGVQVLDHVHPDDRAMIRAGMANTVENGATTIAEARLIHRDGSTVLVEGRAVRLVFDGQPATVVIAHDLTERRQLFARMATADRMLTVGTLAAGVAHEINNPLAYVTANLALLDAELPKLADGQPSRLDRHELAAVLADAHEGASRVSAIVRDLRAMSRPADYSAGPVDVAAALASSLKIASNEIRHRARVAQHIATPLPQVLASSSRLSQVFLNLLVNAAHAIPEGRADANEVRIRATADTTHVHVTIEDTGVGIEPHVLARIFDPFFTTKPPGLGMGLGLSICHHIVQQFGGRIDVTSTVGVGSTFRVSLPIAPEVVLEQPSEAVEPVREPRARILLIDDEIAVGRSIRLLLSPDHDVIAVTRAKDGLALLASGEQYDLILCDLMMPEMSGIELFGRLRADAPDYTSRIIYMTGGAFTPEAQQFLSTIGAETLEKPFSEQQLRTAISVMQARGDRSSTASRNSAR